MAKKFLDNTGLSHLIDLIQGMPDDETIGYTTEAGLHVLDGGITPNKISSLQDLRNQMGLGNTLGALPVENGGTGLTSESAIKEWLESLLDLSGGGGGPTDPSSVFIDSATWNVLSNSGPVVRSQRQNNTYYRLAPTFSDTNKLGSFAGNLGYIKFPYTGTYSISITGKVYYPTNAEPLSVSGSFYFVWNNLVDQSSSSLSFGGGRSTVTAASYGADDGYSKNITGTISYDKINITKDETLAVYVYDRYNASSSYINPRMVLTVDIQMLS